MGSLQRMPRTQLLLVVSVLIVVAMAFANLIDVGGNDSGDEDELVGFLTLSAFGIAVSALLLLVVVPRLRPGSPALVFGVLAIITTVIFWSALPFAFGAAAIAASSSRDDQPEAAGGAGLKAGAALGLLAWLAAFVFCIVG